MVLPAEQEHVRPYSQPQVMLVSFCNTACAGCLLQDSETQGTLQNHGVPLQW